MGKAWLVNVDPDGLSFFTEGHSEQVGEGASVFGSMPDGHLERLLSMEGSEEVGSRFLPEAEAHAGAVSPLAAAAGAAGLEIAVTAHPSMSRGTPEWRLDFVLNGPRASVPAQTPGRLRLISGFRETRGKTRRQNVPSAVRLVAESPATEDDS